MHIYSRKNKTLFTFILSSVVCIFLFQNCSKLNSSLNQSSQINPNNPDNTGNSIPVVDQFVNVLKTIPIETENNKFSPELFPEIGTVLKNYDGQRKVPKWLSLWHVSTKNFQRTKSKKAYEYGIGFYVDHIPNRNEHGYGTRCVDFVYPYNPETGRPWPNNIEEVCNVDITKFISSIPFHHKAIAEAGTVNSYDGYSMEQLYDTGVEYASSGTLGSGDNENGKFNRGFTLTDIENGEHGRGQTVPVLIGMAEKSIGYVLDMYGQSINIAHPSSNYYPLDFKNSNSGYPIGGVINELWQTNYKVSIPGRGVNQKGAIDYPNLLESSEVSSYASSTFRQGDSFAYDNQNSSLLRTVNKFGPDANTIHTIGHVIFGTEVRKWHLWKNFGNRPMLTANKILADRGNIGLTDDHNAPAVNGSTPNGGRNYINNPSLLGSHHNRRTSFLIGMFTGFSGSGWYHWDRNTQKNIDGYNGALAVYNLLSQRKKMSQGDLSFIDLFDNWNWQLWESEISYDNGTTWKKEKGTDYRNSPSSVPYRSVISQNGVWGIFLGRPENTESTNVRVRIFYNNTYKYFDIKPDMWETTNPIYKDTALSNIPNTDKDYYYNLIDLKSL